MWNEQSIRRFWASNRSKFAGDTKASVILSMARKYVRSPVLDVGCGSGALLNLIPGSVGVDVAPKHPRGIVASAAMLPFPEEIFQTVFATDVLEHLPPPIFNDALLEARRVLSPGGHFIATTPADEDLYQNEVQCPYCGGQFHRWGHIQSFTPERIREILTNCGLEVVKLEILPLSQIGDHHSIRYYWKVLQIFGMIRPGDMLIIGVKR